MPDNTVKVDRSTKWGNPFVPGKPAPAGAFIGNIVKDRHHAFELYRAMMVDDLRLRKQAREELRGRNLACWCVREDGFADHCHAAVLLEIAND